MIGVQDFGSRLEKNWHKENEKDEQGGGFWDESWMGNRMSDQGSRNKERGTRKEGQTG